MIRKKWQIAFSSYSSQSRGRVKPCNSKMRSKNKKKAVPPNLTFLAFSPLLGSADASRSAWMLAIATWACWRQSSNKSSCGPSIASTIRSAESRYCRHTPSGTKVTYQCRLTLRCLATSAWISSLESGASTRSLTTKVLRLVLAYR